MGSECLVLRTPAPAWGTARGPPPPDSHADGGTAHRAPPANGSLRHAYRGSAQAPAAFPDSRVRPAAEDPARPSPSEPLKCWGQWSSVLRPGTHLDAALGRASLWEAGQPQPSELLPILERAWF